MSNQPYDAERVRLQHPKNEQVMNIDEDKQQVIIPKEAVWI